MCVLCERAGRGADGAPVALRTAVQCWCCVQPYSRAAYSRTAYSWSIFRPSEKHGSPARRVGSPLQPRGDETPWGASERASEKESWLEVSENGSKAGLDPVESAEVTSLPHKSNTRERTRGGSLTRFTDALERCATNTSSSVGYTHQPAITHTFGSRTTTDYQATTR